VVRQKKAVFFLHVAEEAQVSCTVPRNVLHPSGILVSNLVRHFSWHIEIKKCATTISIWPISLVRAQPIIRTRAMQLQTPLS